MKHLARLLVIISLAEPIGDRVGPADQFDARSFDNESNVRSITLILIREFGGYARSCARWRGAFTADEGVAN
jgi:hypothetical protein